MSKHNFLPEDLQAYARREMLVQWGENFACACFAIFIFVLCSLELLLFDAKKDLENIEASLQQEAFWQDNFKLTHGLEMKNKRLNATLKNLDDASVKQSKILEALGRANISGLWITSVEAEGLHYKITGRSLDMPGLNAWLEELGLNSNFKYSKVLSTEVRSLGISFNVIVSEKKVL